MKGRPSVCFDSSLGLTSAIEGLSAAELPLPAMPFSHRRWIPLNPRYLAGVILKDTLAPPLPQPASEEEPKRFKQTKRSIGKTQLESALSSTFLIGP